MINRKEYFKEYRIKNRDRIIKKSKEYRNLHPEKVKETNKRSYHKNRDKIIEYNHKFYKDNRKKIISEKIIYQRERRKINLNIRIRDNMSAYFRRTLSRRGIKKHGRPIFYNAIGCTIEEIKKYIESKFKKGMTWNNWGTHGWHLDHIIPISKFDLTNEEQLNKCWNYKNFQPLWAKENMSKGRK